MWLLINHILFAGYGKLPDYEFLITNFLLSLAKSKGKKPGAGGLMMAFDNELHEEPWDSFPFWHPLLKHICNLQSRVHKSINLLCHSIFSWTLVSRWSSVSDFLFGTFSLILRTMVMEITWHPTRCQIYLRVKNKWWPRWMDRPTITWCLISYPPFSVQWFSCHCAILFWDR